MSGTGTHTSQFGLVSGIRQAVSDLITIAEPETPLSLEARKGRLYIVTEAEHDLTKGREACQLVARVARKTFYDDNSFSITSGLRAAIRAANKALYQHNVTIPPDRRTYVGLTCAAVRGHDLFVAQVAPAQAYVLTENTIRAFPTHPTWNPAHLNATPFFAPKAVGSSLFVEPELYRCILRSEDALAICCSNLAALLKREDIEHILRSQSAESATETLHSLCRQHALNDSYALVVELTPALRSTMRNTPLRQRGLRERGHVALRSVGDWFAGLSDGVTMAMRGARGKKNARQERPNTRSKQQVNTIYTLPDQPDYPINPVPRPEAIELGEPLHERYIHAHQPQTEKASLPPSAYLGELTTQDYASITQETIDLNNAPAFAARARPYRPRHELRPLIDMTWGERLAVPFQHIGRAVTGRIGRIGRRRVPPPATPVVRHHGLSYRRQKPSFPFVPLLILSMLLAMLILYGINLSHRSSLQRLQAEIDQANQSMAQVYESSDSVVALERLEQARQEIEVVRASTLVTETNSVLWPQFQDLRRDFERAQAQLQRLSFLEDPIILAEHPLPNSRFSSIIMPLQTTTLTDTFALDAQRYMYVLDNNPKASQLYRIPREGGVPEPFLVSGDTVQDTQVGPIYAQAWRVDNVVAVDQGPNGFGYYFRKGGDWNYTRLGGSEIWSLRDHLDLETYEGNLYVWGAETGEILKYVSGQYGDPPALWVDPAGLAGHDLATAIDMDVDGLIYLLQADGKTLVLNAGRVEREIVPAEITPELTIVTGFFITGTPDSGGIFLLDTINERIIQVDKTNGQIIQQIRMHPDSPIQLDHLTDLYVDTTGVRTIMYIVNAGQIIQADLPPEPKPFQPSTETPATSLYR